jgi:hypothetical protein
MERMAGAFRRVAAAFAAAVAMFSLVRKLVLGLFACFFGWRRFVIKVMFGVGAEAGLRSGWVINRLSLFMWLFFVELRLLGLYLLLPWMNRKFLSYQLFLFQTLLFLGILFTIPLAVLMF